MWNYEYEAQWEFQIKEFIIEFHISFPGKWSS